jgi:AcrR family transcriptional regulator
MLLSIYSSVSWNMYTTLRAAVKVGDTHMSRENIPRRKYELKKRAQEMAETHLRITEAAIELHETRGPSRTTMSAVAKRAGVERRTLYRHFPSEAELFAACSTHYFAANPWPDLGSWRAVRDPYQRLERALAELYAYYERTAPMYSNVLRDAELDDLARDAVAPLHTYLEEAAEILTAGHPARGRRRRLVVGALRHALAFSTWKSLTAAGITRADATTLVTAFVEAAVAREARSAGGGVSHFES